MSAQHTPGPFEAVGFSSRESLLKMAAKARLYASSPEMLEALRKVRAFAAAEQEARGSQDETYDYPAADALGVIDRAIAKATGAA